MAITKLNTIQSGVESNYSNNYIKQALSNLGQRSGTKGDSIINQDFKIVDINKPFNEFPHSLNKKETLQIK